MMPLSYATPGEENVIRKVGGSPASQSPKAGTAVTKGGTVKVITALDGNVIVKVKEARVAINDEMARKIMI